MMKNKYSFFIAAVFFLVSVLGCGISRIQKSVSSDNSASNAPAREKTLTDKAVDTTIGEEKIGIAECDQVFDQLTAESESAEDNYIVKATKQYFLNKIRAGIKQSIEENKDDPKKMAQECRKYQIELDKHRAQEAEKKAAHKGN